MAVRAMDSRYRAELRGGGLQQMARLDLQRRGVPAELQSGTEQGIVGGAQGQEGPL